ncbi:hypothetical protein CRI94_06650 [Longibacter salinarum]|uniref:Uncharacterized protein n=1 Tax=Longibacter salinarum TaxID=1850348 RepID=A0A2A8CZC4_9BACT|nr:hypothetical protein [Longibacter salinarum]PEN13748.1 hypothetical protein CRI94_06650 [Longibacter salinarum]
MVSLTACDSNDGDNGSAQADASFTMTISGNGVDKTYEGLAYWAEVTDDQGQTSFAVALTNSQSTQTAATGFIFRRGQRPGSGTYDVVEINSETGTAFTNFGIYLVDATQTSSFTAYYSDGGEIQITESTSNTVAGEFSIPGTVIESSSSGQTETSVTIECDFNATNNPSLVAF